jgi:hypothetical protein
MPSMLTSAKESTTPNLGAFWLHIDVPGRSKWTIFVSRSLSGQEIEEKLASVILVE